MIGWLFIIEMPNAAGSSNNKLLQFFFLVFPFKNWLAPRLFTNSAHICCDVASPGTNLSAHLHLHFEANALHAALQWLQRPSSGFDMACTT